MRPKDNGSFALDDGERIHAACLGPDDGLDRRTDLVYVDAAWQAVSYSHLRKLRDTGYTAAMRLCDTGATFRVKHIHSSAFFTLEEVDR